jgi:REP element-mobilizing transposase RayT
MARPLRILAAGLTYHVSARGNAKMTIFEDVAERRKLLRILETVCGELAVDCLAYCLMSNHYHLVICTQEPNLSLVMQTLNSTYAAWWNKRRGRVGHVFQGRFHAQVVQDGDYLLTACRYVVRNPVKAGLVRTPREWTWSSYRATAGYVRPPAFLRADRLLSLFGSDDPQGACDRFRSFVCAGDADADTLPEGSVFGDDSFVGQFIDQFAAADIEIPGRDKNLRPPLFSLFSGAVSRRRRDDQILEALGFGHSVVAVARYLQVDRSTIYRIAGSRRRRRASA